MTVRILVGDAMARLAELPRKSAQCCVTSPPYFGLRRYLPVGHADAALEIGTEETPERFISRLVTVFGLVREVLTDDGLLFLNIGDSYNAAGRTGHGTRIGYKRDTNRASNSGADNRRPSVDSLKPKDLIGIPWMLAFALRADGWYLRSEIIWHKIAPMPESVTDRPTRAHETVFMLSKRERYFYNAAEARDELKPTSVARLTQPNYDEQEGSERANGGAKTNGKMKAVARASWKGSTFDKGKTGEMLHTRGGLKPHTAKAAHFGGRNKSKINDQTRLASGNEWQQDPAAGANWRDVWPMASEGYDEAHFAVMPSALAQRCIMAGSRPGDTVVDPFFGAGTTGLAADRLQRNCIGIELNASNPAMAESRIRRESPMFAQVSIEYPREPGQLAAPCAGVAKLELQP